MRVKICGITNEEDALAAVRFGADALGFVFYKGSPRYVKPSTATAIINALPPLVTTVGVFVDCPEDEMLEIARQTGIGVVQLHGSEPPERCKCFPRVIKAIRVRTMEDLAALRQYEASAYLLDTYVPGEHGGTGQVFNWDIAHEAGRTGKRIILAGGLTPENIRRAVAQVRPYAVDVSSGVEKDKGIKDHTLLQRFIYAARDASDAIRGG